MSVMEDQKRPSPFFGDHPHGSYWSAVAPESTQVNDEEEDYTVEGSELRIMWDEGAGPLWSDDGLLPDATEWLRLALGLSDSLSADLLSWLRDMTGLHFESHVGDWEEQRRQLDERGREQAERVQRQVGTRYRVSYG